MRDAAWRICVVQIIIQINLKLGMSRRGLEFLDGTSKITQKRVLRITAKITKTKKVKKRKERKGLRRS